MDSKVSTFWRKVSDEHRITIPRRIDLKWSKKRPITFVPLMWLQSVDLPDERQMEVWAICDLDVPTAGDGTSGTLKWRVNPHRVLYRAQYDQSAADLASLIYEERLEGRTGAWKVIIPKGIRNLGWLPTEGGHVVLRSDANGLSVWTETAFRIYLASLAIHWDDTED